MVTINWRTDCWRKAIFFRTGACEILCRDRPFLFHQIGLIGIRRDRACLRVRLCNEDRLENTWLGNVKPWWKILEGSTIWLCAFHLWLCFSWVGIVLGFLLYRFRAMDRRIEKYFCWRICILEFFANCRLWLRYFLFRSFLRRDTDFLVWKFHDFLE